MICPCLKVIVVTNSNAWEFIGTFFGEKCQNHDFLENYFPKFILYPDENLHLIFVMLQINKTKRLFF